MTDGTPPAAPRYKRPYIDATTWIDHLGGLSAAGTPQEAPGRVEVAAEIFALAEAGRIKVVASTLTVVELLKDPAIDDDGVADLRQWLRRSCFVWVDLTLPVAEHARELARRHGLKPRDAVHAASAAAGGADVLLSSDGDFKPGRAYGGVIAHRPYFPFDRQLPLRDADPG